jgi:hypothetical protein
MYSCPSPPDCGVVCLMKPFKIVILVGFATFVLSFAVRLAWVLSFSR